MDLPANFRQDPQAIAQLINEIRQIKEIMLLQSQVGTFETQINDLSHNVTEQSKALRRKDYEISMLKAEINLLSQSIENNEYAIEWLDDRDETKPTKNHSKLFHNKTCGRIVKFFKSLV